jgi:hypothetical protein
VNSEEHLACNRNWWPEDRISQPQERYSWNYTVGVRLEAGFAGKSIAWALEIQVEFDFVGKTADSTPVVAESRQFPVLLECFEKTEKPAACLDAVVAVATVENV